MASFSKSYNKPLFMLKAYQSLQLIILFSPDEQDQK